MTSQLRSDNVPADLSTPFSRICDLFKSDLELERDERGPGGPRVFGTDETADIVKRDEQYLDWALRYLEEGERQQIATHEHIVAKTLALAGWFGLLFAGLAIAASLMRVQATSLSSCGQFLVAGIVGSALVFFALSLWGVCRVLWRIRLWADQPAWILKEEYRELHKAKAERILELVQREVMNKAPIGVKARLYQGSVWAFFLAITSMLAGLAALAVL